MKKNKLLRVIIVLISIINIIFLIYGYNTNIQGSHSFNESLSSSTFNNDMLSVLVLIIQVLNIVIAMLFSKLSLNKPKKILVFVALLFILTVVIPVGGLHSIEYKMPTSQENGLFQGSTTHIHTYKNIYGITLTTSESTSGGIEYY